MTTLQISLDDRQQAFVDAQAVATGHASGTDYVLSLLRDAEKRAAWRQLEPMVLAGLDSPAQEMTADDWQRLRQRKPEVSQLPTP